MSVKSDRWIRRMAAQGMIEPFEPGQVREVAGRKIVSYGTSSYGYDIRCAREFKIFTNINSTIVDPKAFDPNSFVDFEGDAIAPLVQVRNVGGLYRGKLLAEQGSDQFGIEINHSNVWFSGAILTGSVLNDPQQRLAGEPGGLGQGQALGDRGPPLVGDGVAGELGVEPGAERPEVDDQAGEAVGVAGLVGQQRQRQDDDALGEGEQDGRHVDREQQLPSIHCPLASPRCPRPV